MVGGSLRVLPASSTTKTGRHDIAEILLKVASKHQKSPPSPKKKIKLDNAFYSIITRWESDLLFLESFLKSRWQWPSWSTTLEKQRSIDELLFKVNGEGFHLYLWQQNLYAAWLKK